MEMDVRHMIPTALALALLMSVTGHARADDRDPTPDERAAIEQVLRSNGYVAWDDIELDDGFWEVDDARTPDGQEFDLDLHPQTLQIVRRTPD